MIALLCFFLTLLASPFKSKSRLEAENAALRHQLIVLGRRASGRVQLTNGDRLFFVNIRQQRSSNKQELHWVLLAAAGWAILPLLLIDPRRAALCPYGLSIELLANL